MCTCFFVIFVFFFFNDTATTEIYTLSLHDALPILIEANAITGARGEKIRGDPNAATHVGAAKGLAASLDELDRKSTRLNSSHANISYAVFCLKKKKNKRMNLVFIHIMTMCIYCGHG